MLNFSLDRIYRMNRIHNTEKQYINIDVDEL